VFTSGPPQAERPARLALRRRIPQRLKRLIKRLMPGVFTSGSPQAEQLAQQEWNALLDPHATAIVYQSPVALHRSVGLDVTARVRLPAATVRQKFQAPLLRPVLDFAEVFFREADTITFHDPLAATTLFDPAICRFERGAVAVELTDEARLGQTRWTPGGPGAPHEVALGVDAERFFEHYFAVLNGV
jgi:inosine-uridine nucleoside N-ribohydrolase